MLKQFICTDFDKCYGIGNTLEEAFAEYREYHDNETIENLTFFEAVPVEIEVKIIAKPIPVAKRGEK